MPVLFTRDDWKLTEEDKEAFEEELSNLQIIVEENADYFNSLKADRGIRSTQIMAVLAREYFRAKLIYQIPDLDKNQRP